MKELRDSVNIDSFSDDEEEGSKQHDNVYTQDSPTIRPIAYKDLDIPVLKISRYSGCSGSGRSDLLPHTPAKKNSLQSPFSISSFIGAYGETRPGSMVEQVVEERKRHRRNVDSVDTVSSGGSVKEVAQVDEMKVRPWALLAWRWLAFDRVLVSPAAHAMMKGRGKRMLVVDGLGTDDWSFYCALTYPTAKIYNLTSTPPPLGPAPPSSPHRPPNHKQVHHPSLTAAFPFPRGFFDLITFRFPSSATQPHWPLLLGECKRVLAPGGEIEVVVMESRLVGMGPRARRARRRRREREKEKEMQSESESQRVLKILERKGFEDIATCVLALPVVGSVDAAQAQAQTHGSDSAVGVEASGKNGNTGNTDPDEPGSVNDVLGKVARWWYSRCYERVITGGGEEMGRSMWCERGLVRECARRGTRVGVGVVGARKPGGRGRV
ncbi:hypothetical protein EX30DRAFT_308287 [Ascodesmis nigricans]|uniref:Methyltransferase type 11 domain-containing protein n=1 Tax=Ascodesmis nigricans TaxID=341454 RepID=A0A4S2MU09_9PEZI|nr:hypothetical protein EX30DRAFT_308287 [Ascodesmis nigricans]